MAQVTKQSIVLGGGRIVGTVSVDGGAFRAEGGPIRPQLIVPVTIPMNPHLDEAMIAVVWLLARLGTDRTPLLTRRSASRSPSSSSPVVTITEASPGSITETPHP